MSHHHHSLVFLRCTGWTSLLLRGVLRKRTVIDLLADLDLSDFISTFLYCFFSVTLWPVLLNVPLRIRCSELRSYGLAYFMKKYILIIYILFSNSKQPSSTISNVFWSGTYRVVWFLDGILEGLFCQVVSSNQSVLPDEHRVPIVGPYCNLKHKMYIRGPVGQCKTFWLQTYTKGTLVNCKNIFVYNSLDNQTRNVGKEKGTGESETNTWLIEASQSHCR